MRQFFTAVVERQRDFVDQFGSHPYEVGWASEAIFFLRVEEIFGEGAKLNARVQISADGVRWIDEGTALPTMTEARDYFVRVKHFGGWLRLFGEISGQSARFKLTVQLVLKE
jgi:hypothetical protein